MAETIVTIYKYSEAGWSGFRIRTDQRDINLAISNEQCCCEEWGYFLTEDDVTKYRGSELYGVEITDTARNTEKMPEGGLDEGDVMFVDIRTSRGVLQFVAYNAHNGYYGHTASIYETRIIATRCL